MICPFCCAESLAYLVCDGADGVPGMRNHGTSTLSWFLPRSSLDSSGSDDLFEGF